MHQHMLGKISSSRGKSEVGSTPKWRGQRFQQTLKRLPSFLGVKSQKIKPVHQLCMKFAQYKKIILTTDNEINMKSSHGSKTRNSIKNPNRNSKNTCLANIYRNPRKEILDNLNDTHPIEIKETKYRQHRDK